MIYADLRAQPGAAGRRAPGLVSFGQAAFFGIGAYATVLLSPRVRRGVAAAGCCRLAMLAAGAVRAVRRRAVAAHQGRLLHHGHAGLRADGLLRVPRHAAGRRHRRHLPVRASRCRVAGRRCSTSTSRCALYYFTLALPGGRVRASWRCCCARASAARWPASASTSSACAPPASPPIRYKLAAFVIVGRAGRAGGLPVRGEGRLRQPRAADLAPVGRGADDDHPRRPGPPARRGARRLRLRAAAGVLPVARRSSAPSPSTGSWRWA